MKNLISLNQVKWKKSFIEITVTGYGCTAAEHFKVKAVRKNTKCLVSIYRTHPDFCQRMPMPISLKLPWNSEEVCGDDEIEVVNPRKPAA